MRELKGCDKPKIFIGSLEDAINGTLLKEHDIDIVFNVCNDIVSPVLPGFIYMKWGLDDPEDGLAYLNDVTSATALLNMIVYTHARRDGNILIHCASGHNRSALVAANWLKKYRGVNFKKAIKMAQVKDQKNWMIDKGFTW